jgi:hypothetical protein
MSEVPLYAGATELQGNPSSGQACTAPRPYRDTSLIRSRIPPEDPTVGLCLGLYGGPREGGGFL